MNPYGVDISESNIQKPLISLKVLYEGMPETEGCEKCEEINGDAVQWCCKLQNPSLHYVEFLYVWKYVQKTYDKNSRLSLIVRAITNYLSNSSKKGCIFFVNDEGCTIHKHRPFSCRMYGVVPEENWTKRWDALNAEMGDQFDAIPQCPHVKTKSGEPVTSQQEDKWYEYIKKCERDLGVSEAHIKLHDRFGGPYRTFHDHILIELFDDVFLNKLSSIRMANPSTDEIDKFVFALKKAMEGGVIVTI